MAAKDSESSSDGLIFGGDSKFVPPASYDRIARTQGKRTKSSPKLAMIHSGLNELQRLVDKIRALCQSVRKLFVTVSSIIVLVSLVWSYLNGHLAPQHLQFLLKLFR